MKTPIAMVMLLTVSAAAADLTGKWSGTFRVEGGDHPIPQLFILKKTETLPVLVARMQRSSIQLRMAGSTATT